MTNRVWHKGPPPHVGWWNASIAGDLTAWRWWDGVRWSLAAYEDDNEFVAEDFGKLYAIPAHVHSIEWTDYYPKNARVPRINPKENK